MNNNDFHQWLSSKTAGFLSWLSAFLGLGTAVGVVNLTVGVLSATYLCVQIYNWFTYTRPMNKMKLQHMRESAGLTD